MLNVLHPTVIFLKGLRDLTFSDRLLKEQNGNKYRFTLKNTTPRDSGTYWMVARNELGTDRAFVTISVKILKTNKMYKHNTLNLRMFNCAGTSTTQRRES